MPPKNTTVDTNDLVRRYLAGESANAIGKAVGLPASSIMLRLRAAGAPIRDIRTALRLVVDGRTDDDKRRMTASANQARWKDLDVYEIIRRYRAGESIKAIAQSVLVACDTIKSRLIMAGEPIRDPGKAQRMRLSKLTPDQRREFARKSFEARRGSKATETEKIRRARSRQQAVTHVGGGEAILMGWLSERGYRAIPQMAVGPYNIDLGIPPIAVELRVGPTNPLAIASQRRKLEYLIDRQFFVVFVWITSRHFLTPGAANYVVAYLKAVERNPSTVGQYRVIRGTGELVASGRSDFD